MALLLLWFLLQLFASTFHGSSAQTQSPNITLGSILSATENSSWLSPSGDYAFGFYPVNGGLYLVGIWFDKIPSRTLVWSANRDQPVQNGSTLELTSTGWLVIHDPRGVGDLYIYNESSANTASMQDNGNFVLKNSSSSIVWQSFHSPTDTLLPGQVLNLYQTMFSNANGTTDFSTGRYRLQMQGDGNIVMSAFQFADPGYWYVNKGAKPTFIFNESTALMYVAVNTTFNYPLTDSAKLSTPIGDYYHRARIDDKGNFIQYAHRKHNGTWNVVWRAIDDPCFPTALCGEYGYCVLDSNQEPSCKCLEGFLPVDPIKPWKGCYAEIPPQQSCGGDASKLNFTLEVMNDADFPNDARLDLSRIEQSDSESCRRAVMEDCFCMAAVLEDGICRKKRAPLLSGRMGSNATGRIAFIKVATRTAARTTKGCDSRVLVAAVVPISVIAVLFAALALYGYISYRRKPMKRKGKSSLYEVNLQEYTYEEVKDATGGFTRKLGRGGFGTVYYGSLRIGNKQIEVAVKQLERVIEDADKEFKTELTVIGRTHHKNLVRLVGFCNEGKHKLLVYELMKGGSLSDLLFKGSKMPSWSQRSEISLGIARGLAYLHEECETQIIHCDIKPQNVLLDENYAAKIADFGLAKLLLKDQTRTSTKVRGTMGYMAPEWLKKTSVTAKVDVYSFGVVLLETICCRRHIELDRIEEESEDDEIFITDWVVRCMRDGEMWRLVEEDKEALSDMKMFERMAMVGLWCVNPDPSLRPSMKRVRQMLEGTSDVGVPPLIVG